jgi:hypothetical protein
MYDYSSETSSLTNTDPNANSAVMGLILGGGIMLMLVWLALVVFGVAVMWRTFTKAGQPGWASIVPIYNLYVLMKIAGRPGWWLLLMLVPFVNIIMMLIVSIDIAKAFGKETAFGVFGLWMFSIIGYAILAFSNVKYVAPATAKKA